MSDPPSVPPSPPASMSSEERSALALAASLHQPLKRAARLGRANGAGYVIFGGLSLALALMDPDLVGIAIGVVLLGVGIVERQQSARLLHADPAAPRRLAGAELTLLCAIVGYGILGLTVLPSSSEMVQQQLGDTRGLGIDVKGLADSVRQAWYGTVIAVGLLYQGGMARYFLRRGEVLLRYRTAVPAWAREVVESMAG